MIAAGEMQITIGGVAAAAGVEGDAGATTNDEREAPQPVPCPAETIDGGAELLSLLTRQRLFMHFPITNFAPIRQCISITVSHTTLRRACIPTDDERALSCAEAVDAARLRPGKPGFPSIVFSLCLPVGMHTVQI